MKYTFKLEFLCFLERIQKYYFNSEYASMLFMSHETLADPLQNVIQLHFIIILRSKKFKFIFLSSLLSIITTQRTS